LAFAGFCGNDYLAGPNLRKQAVEITGKVFSFSTFLLVVEVF